MKMFFALLSPRVHYRYLVCLLMRFNILSTTLHVHYRYLGWMKSFSETDPRRLIAKFFDDGDNRGPAGYLLEQGLLRSSDEDVRQHDGFMMVYNEPTLYCAPCSLCGAHRVL